MRRHSPPAVPVLAVALLCFWGSCSRTSPQNSGLLRVQAAQVQWPALRVWPYPASVVSPDNVTRLSTGPVSLVSNGSAATEVVVDPACGAQVAAIAERSLFLGYRYRDVTRTWSETPAYQQRDDAFCATDRRCAVDDDCQGSGACYVPWSVRWSAAQACAPSSLYNAKCGCCVASASSAATPPRVSVLSISCSATASGGSGRPTGVDGGYHLEVSAVDGSAAPHINITASTARGAAYALMTLAQLLQHEPALGVYVLPVSPLVVDDAPALEWRGMMVDTSRHFIPLDDLKAVVDGMLAAKMTPLHWHIVDSPSFPFAADSNPALAEEGSWSGDAATTYSPADVAGLVQYAADRFVEVLLEIDTPAHTLSWGKGEPDIMTDCYEWLSTWPAKDEDRDDAVAIDPTAPKAPAVVSSLLAEVAELSGDGRYLHIGGDEIKSGCWNASARIQAAVVAKFGDLSDTSFRKLQAEWTRDVSAAAVVKAGKTPVMWQATPSGPADPAWNASAGLPSDMIYMSWLNTASVAAYAKAGSRVVATAPFYVAGYAAGAWSSEYEGAVVPANLTAAQRANVLGGQVCVWGETMDASNVATLAWQVGGAAAENFWSGNTVSIGDNRVGIMRRLNWFLCHVGAASGVRVPPLLPSYCALRVGEAVVPPIVA